MYRNDEIMAGKVHHMRTHGLDQGLSQFSISKTLLFLTLLFLSSVFK